MSGEASEVLPEELVMSASQIRCLASPLRSQILIHLQSGQRLTAAELSAQMGIPLKRIYHHLHALLEAELIRVTETHRKRGQEEALYGAIARRYILRPDPKNPEYLDAAADRVDATFRAASREHRRLLEAAPEHPELLEFGTVLRLDVCVSKATAKELIQALQRLLDVVQEQHAPDNEQRLSITVAVLPDTRIPGDNADSESA